jgi:hypothetical protein
MQVEIMAGAFPSPITKQFLRWIPRLRIAFDNNCPLVRDREIYFDFTNGNDTTGDGTISNPYKTLAKAQTEHDAWTENSAGLALLFKRGQTWVGNTGLNITKKYVTVCDYGDTTLERPIFSAFSTAIAAGGAVWSVATATRYTAAVAANIGWIIEKGNPFKVYRRVTSTGEVEANKNSFFWSAGTLHIHATNAYGQAVDPDTIEWEHTLLATTADSGVDFATTSGFCRCENILTYGWGCNGNGTINQEYGIKTQMTGTNVAYVKGCGSYYNSAHCIGNNPGSGSAGGITMYEGCDVGLCTAQDATMFIAYSGLGAQENVYINNRVKYGALPITAARDYHAGVAGYMHSNGTAIGFGLSVGNRVEAPANRIGCAGGFGYGNTVTATGIADVKAINFGNVMEKGKGTGANGDATNPGGHNIYTSNVAEINCIYRFQPLTTTIDAFGSGNPLQSYVINCIVEVDFRYSADAAMCFYNPTGPNSPRTWHSLICLWGNGTTVTGLNYDNQFDNNGANQFTDSALAELKNSIWQYIRTGSADASNQRLRMANSATTLVSNAYFGLTADGSLDANGLTTNRVDLTVPVRMNISRRSNVPTGLADRGANLGVQFDIFGRTRDVLPCIGPWEDPTTAFEYTDLLTGVFSEPIDMGDLF